MTLKALTTPVEIKAGTQVIYLPVENYYGNKSISGIAAVSVGRPLQGGFGGLDKCFNVCSGRLNYIGISLSGYGGTGALQPGTEIRF